jgi:hypothetical protein
VVESNHVHGRAHPNAGCQSLEDAVKRLICTVEGGC